MDSHIDVLVIGAGVSGLTVAICLAEAGLAVRVRTRRFPAATSCAAGAVWGPYLTDDERVLPWSERSRVILTGLANDPASGVRVVHGLEASQHGIPPPTWAQGLDSYRVAAAAELPAGFTSGWWYSAPVIDMPVYLDYLVRRLAASGGTIEVGEVRSLEAAAALAPIVVNCAGVEASELTDDPELTPVRGELVVVENPGIDTFFAQHDESAEPVYYLPQGNQVVLGGSVLPGRTDLEPDAKIAAAITARCAAIEPRLGNARVIGHRVGLRPSRPRVRLELEQTPWGQVVHNYGHGGAGVTMSWGCALEVARLVHPSAYE
ncbi:MAG TPA: FAD-dependent oxidoreductase [Natronosporangium sp.]